MILVLYYANESKESQEALRKDAENIKKKVDARGKNPQGKETKIVEQGDFEAYALSEDAQWEYKIHIVAHGNQAQVGNFNGEGLGQFLLKALRKLKKVKQITVHSCCAAARHPSHPNSLDHIFTYQLASYLLENLTGRYIEVRGSVGEAYTASDGRNWVLQKDQKLPAEKPSNLHHEQQMVREIMRQDRGAARPVFAIQNGELFVAQRHAGELDIKKKIVGGQLVNPY